MMRDWYIANVAGSKTIEQRIADTGGYTSGFDYLRIILSVLVLVNHSVQASYGFQAAFTKPEMIINLANMILPLFFALSGFLVSASLLRVSLPRFVGLRILRIFPALVVEVALSALILGPLLTQVDLSTYFGSTEFHSYFRNMVGDIHYYLPGVFENNPFPRMVNGPLWTVPYELECYIVLVALALLRIVKFWQLTLIALIVASGAQAYWDYSHGIPGSIYGRMLVMYFLGGVTIYGMRNFIPLRLDLFVFAFAVAFALIASSKFIYLSPIFIGYCTAWLGLLNVPKLKVIFTGDYSYGIYLYAFPIQQTVVYLSPPSLNEWYFNSIFSLIIVSIFAAFSWHCVEKPFGKLKRYLKSGNSGKRDAQLIGDADRLAKPTSDQSRSPI